MMKRGPMADMKRMMDDLAEKVGQENEDGTFGSGLTGRIMRTEAKVLAYDRLKERVIGGLMAGTAALAAFWWFAKDRIATFFNVAGS